jgi:hypothetical protein
VNNNLKSPKGPCLVSKTYRNNPITTVGTESKELKIVSIILIPGNFPWLNANETRNAKGVVNKIALRETKKESRTIDHNSGSPVKSNCKAC